MDANELKMQVRAILSKSQEEIKDEEKNFVVAAIKNLSKILNANSAHDKYQLLVEVGNENFVNSLLRNEYAAFGLSVRKGRADLIVCMLNAEERRLLEPIERQLAILEEKGIHSETRDFLDDAELAALSDELQEFDRLDAEKKALQTKIGRRYIEYSENDEFNFNEKEKAKLIVASKDGEYAKRIIMDGGITTAEAVRECMRLSCDSELLKFVIRNDIITSFDRGIFFSLASDRSFCREIISEKKDKLSVKDLDKLIRLFGSDKDKEEWNRHIINIKDISELNIDELNNNPDITMVRVAGEHVTIPEDALYPKEKYIAIMEQINLLTGDIEPAVKGDKESELRAFREVYKRLADNIAYDAFAISKEGQENEVLKTSCRNLEGGILRRRVCLRWIC